MSEQILLSAASTCSLTAKAPTGPMSVDGRRCSPFIQEALMRGHDSLSLKMAGLNKDHGEEKIKHQKAVTGPGSGGAGDSSWPA